MGMTIKDTFAGIVGKLGEHKTAIAAAQTTANNAAIAAANSVQSIRYPDGTPLSAQNGVVTLPATVLSGLTIDPTTGLAQVAPGSGSGTGTAGVIAAIAPPNIVQPL